MVMKVKTKIDHQKKEEEEAMPVSPLAQYLNSSALSLSVYAVLEFLVPVNDLPISLVSDDFLPINPRFSSIMVSDQKTGAQKWKPVKVNVTDHFFAPEYPDGLSPEEYEECLYSYISKIALEELPQSQPLWQIHKFNYPTTNSKGSVIFKFHHALGDGYSLMGALLSCLQRADNPSLPLTLPSRQSSNSWPKRSHVSFLKTAAQFSYTLVTSLLDFGRSMLRSSVMEDDLSPIRSSLDGVEFRPMAITTMAFSLDHIKKITKNLKVTVNDVMTGAILLGVRMYMEGEMSKSSSANSTALAMLNTRDIGGYASVSEMLKPKASMPWGNHFAFLHLPIPKLSTADSHDPLDFVFQTHQTVKRLKSNYAAFLTAQFLDVTRKVVGPQATSKLLHSTMKNTSMTISNMIGPVEHMALANHPIKGLFFTASGLPQSLTVGLISYVGTLRATIATEEGFIDPNTMKIFIQKAYEDRSSKSSNAASDPVRRFDIPAVASNHE